MRIQSIGIVGTGSMGTGIAKAAARAGHPVVIVKWTGGHVADASRKFSAAIAREVESNRLAAQDADIIAGNVVWTDDRAALGDRDLVIESIVEDLRQKLDCFAVLDAATKPEAMLATNTSSLCVAEIASATKRPERVIGMHFFNPVSAMRLVEVAVTDAVSPATVDAALSFLRGLGKEAVVIRDSPGFAVNRLMMSSLLEAVRAVFVDRPPVSDIAGIDACMRLGANHPMGPFQLMDFIGIDVVYAMAVSLQEGFRSERFSPPTILDLMIENGWLGRKTGIGFYDYSDRKNPRPNRGLQAHLAGP